MNDLDRKRLQEAKQLVEDARSTVEALASDEQEKFDNLSEGLQASEKGQKLEATASNLADLANDLENLLDAFDNVEE